MSKAILYSIVFATFLIPLLAAKERSYKRAFRVLVVLMVSFEALYLVGISFFYYPHLEQRTEERERP